METLTKLSARSLEYYINARRWQSELDFFELEVDFLNKLIKECCGKNPDKVQLDQLLEDRAKLSELINEKHQIRELLDQQLKILELLAQGLQAENIEELTGKHASLDSLMMDWVSEYRKLKKDLFKTIENQLNPLAL